MESLKDASKAQKVRMDWWTLFESGDAEYFLGEPGTSEGFLLPEYCGLTEVPISGLGLCLVHLKNSGEWYLVPARKNVDAWEIAGAYLRTGYNPPILLIRQLTASPRTSRQECSDILDQYHAHFSTHGSDVESARILLHIKSRLGL